MSRTDIQKIGLSDPIYPKALKKIENHPDYLYLRGRIPKNRTLAIVGARHYSDYGKRMALRISRRLTQAGLVIVSGMATGIDTFAHRGCLKAGGRTIAVLGTGVDERSIYPSSNKKLARQIVEQNGAVLSEYPPGTRSRSYQFPQRNRIVSGLSEGVLVIEAKKKSGSLITARWAREQNRPLFAVPGPTNSPNSQGTNWLIQKGAFSVTKAEDILDKIGINTEPKQRRLELKSDKKLIVQVLKKEALHIEDIIRYTGLPAARTVSLLSKMEADNKVVNLKENKYGLKI